MSGRIVLVIGGARSGKSSFAEKYVLRQGAYCAYIATAEILDEEMETRVKIHQSRRSSKKWKNYEAPYQASEVIIEAAECVDAILFDCITLYLSNLMYGKDAPEIFEDKVKYVNKKIKELIESAQKTNKTVVFVANDVGAGIVPDNPMAREYRDIAGWATQSIGEAADEVYYVLAGQAVDIKKLAFKFE